MRRVLVLLVALVPGIAVAGPTFTTTVSVSIDDGAEHRELTNVLEVAARAKLAACWRREGDVKARITIAASRVTKVVVVGKVDARLRACVVKALRGQRVAGSGVDAGTAVVALTGVRAPEAVVLGGFGAGGLAEGDFVFPADITKDERGAERGTRQRGMQPEAKVAVGPVDGDTGGLTADVVHRVMKARAGAYRACYQRELARSPKLAGKVIVSFRISEAGNVVTSRIVSTTTASAALDNCVNNNVRRLKFPASERVSNVTYPFVFGST